MNAKQILAAILLYHLAGCALTDEQDHYKNEQSRSINQSKVVIQLEKNEKWWGGCVADGSLMPFGSNDFTANLFANTKANQAQPLLISNHGRFVWSEQPFSFTFKKGTLTIESQQGTVIKGKKGNTLASVHSYVTEQFFPHDGRIPDPLLFTNPQYNTWIELTYDQRETRIRKYAEDIIANDFPAGVLMIDDNWQQDYGVWDFHPGRFTKPKDMVDSLHSQGFKVMLWVCPFVSPDCETFRELERKNFILKRSAGNVYICKWWNGYSALMDFTNDDALKWFTDRLSYLVTEYGVDGFKFDGGDAHFYLDYCMNPNLYSNPNLHSELWAKLGAGFPLNEYRACWKSASLPLAQRLRDKRHNWDDLQKLIPDAIAMGLIGYPFVCPDMIGGGEFKSFLSAKTIDQQLVVRSAQCSALMPMMQFSVAPWRILDDKNLAICLEMAKLHEKMGPEILTLANQAAKTGQPIIRHMEYVYPNQGYAEINDQFMLGDSILVAPVLEKDKTSRTIVLPKGTWIADDGKTIIGPAKKQVPAPIERLPWYQLKKEQ